MSDATVGQKDGELLAKTGSFDILFLVWVLGIGFSDYYVWVMVWL